MSRNGAKKSGHVNLQKRTQSFSAIEPRKTHAIIGGISPEQCLIADAQFRLKFAHLNPVWTQFNPNLTHL
jgi:hypothetical protein